MPIAQGLLVAVPLFWLAMRNHRSLERGATLVRRQASWGAAFLIAVLLLGAVADGALNAGGYWANVAAEAESRRSPRRLPTMDNPLGSRR
jgi:hypothetical protein